MGSVFVEPAVVDGQTPVLGLNVEASDQDDNLCANNDEVAFDSRLAVAIARITVNVLAALANQFQIIETPDYLMAGPCRRLDERRLLALSCQFEMSANPFAIEGKADPKETRSTRSYGTGVP